jgi:hypothetical protein
MVKFFKRIGYFFKFMFGDHRPEVLDKAMGDEKPVYVMEEVSKEQDFAEVVKEDWQIKEEQPKEIVKEELTFSVPEVITLDNTRGIKVRKSKTKGDRYLAFVTFYPNVKNGKPVSFHIGTFDTIEEAYYARLKYILDEII